MASSTSSLHYLSLTTQTLSLSKPNISFSKLSFPFSLSSLKLSLSSTSSKPLFNSRFLRTVAISSEQVEDVFDSEEDDEEPEERSYAAPSPDAKLFVGNLPFSVDSATLAGLFEQTGNVEMVEVIYDKITGRSRGFAFVTMGSAQEAEAAVEQFNNYELDGRPLRVNCGPPPPKRESPYGSRDGGSSYGSRDRGSSYGGGSRDGGSSYGGGSRDGGSYGTSRGGGGSSYGGARGGGSSSFGNSNRVYVGNLSWGVDDSALATLFSESGNVVEAKVVYDRESGRSRGFGFVTYNSSDEVNSAIESLDGADLDGRSIRVSPAEARQKREF